MRFVALGIFLAVMVACSGEPASSPNSATVVTVAGTQIRGFKDGPSTEAQLNSPEGIAVARDGTLYIAETLSGRIRKIDPDGTVTTLLGGEGSGPRLKAPHRLAIGPDGGVYVTDAGNNRIIRVTENGEFVVVAGDGESGYRDGPAAEAQFNFPIGIGVGPDGTVYVADTGNLRVRKVSPDGLVTTVAGTGESGYRDGRALQAQFAGLNELAVDDAGNIYVTEVANERVRKITPSGDVVTVAGTGERGSVNGSAANARFDGPAGIAVDASGNIYVAEFGNHGIRKISPDQEVSVLAGGNGPGFTDGPAAESRFKAPFGIAVDSNGVIYVADSGNHVIRKIVP